MAKVYWLHGQPGSGKSTIGKRLQIWLQTDKANWRKTVFHIDEDKVKSLYTENHLEHIVTISNFLLSTNHDVVVTAATPSKDFREIIKDKLKAVEIYCHSKNKSAKSNVIVEYELPEKLYVDLDTTGPEENSFGNLIKMIL
jgi:adenylylsulfate kinase-like enzyme